MEKVFRDKDLATYFNNNFVNYRANMESGSDAEFIKSEYGVVFLPTFIILDPSGNVEFKYDHEMSAAQLLAEGRKAINPKSYYAAIRKENAASKPKKVVVERSAEQDEKVLLVLDETGEMDADLLYNEAYFRLELIDGSHKKAAADYLSTQSDWTTEKNMNFIMDFTESVDSKQFKYMVNNKASFDDRYGKERVDRLLNIVVYNRLHNGIPRPSLSEAIQLYKKIEAKDPLMFGYHYFINRQMIDGDPQEMLETVKEYLDQRPMDKQMVEKISSFIASSPNLFDKRDQRFAHDLIDDLIKQDESNLDYHIDKIKVLVNLEKCEEASDVVTNYFSHQDTDVSHSDRVSGILSKCK